MEGMQPAWECLFSGFSTGLRESFSGKAYNKADCRRLTSACLKRPTWIFRVIKHGVFMTVLQRRSTKKKRGLPRKALRRLVEFKGMRQDLVPGVSRRYPRPLRRTARCGAGRRQPRFAARAADRTRAPRPQIRRHEPPADPRRRLRSGTNPGPSPEADAPRYTAVRASTCRTRCSAARAAVSKTRGPVMSRET